MHFRTITALRLARSVARPRFWSFSPKHVHRTRLCMPQCLRYFSSSEQACWSCGTGVSSGASHCKSCNTLQPAACDLNAFELFGLNQQYDLCGDTLTDTYRDMQKLLHPDRFAGHNDERGAQTAQDLSAKVNDAYHALSNPMERAKLLLECRWGVEWEGGEGEQRQSVVEQVGVPPAFLMHVMETREAIDSCDKEEAKRLWEEVCESKEEVIAELRRHFDLEPDQDQAIRTVIRMSYIDRMLDSLDGKVEAE